MHPKRFAITIVTLAACSASPPEVGVAAQDLAEGLTVPHSFGPGEGSAPRGALAEVNGRRYGLDGAGGPSATASCNRSASWNTVEHIRHCPGALFSLALDGSRFCIEHAFTSSTIAAGTTTAASVRLARGKTGVVFRFIPPTVTCQ